MPGAAMGCGVEIGERVWYKLADNLWAQLQQL